MNQVNKTFLDIFVTVAYEFQWPFPAYALQKDTHATAVMEVTVADIMEGKSFLFPAASWDGNKHIERAFNAS